MDGMEGKETSVHEDSSFLEKFSVNLLTIQNILRMLRIDKNT